MLSTANRNSDSDDDDDQTPGDFQTAGACGVEVDWGGLSIASTQFMEEEQHQCLRIVFNFVFTSVLWWRTTSVFLPTNYLSECVSYDGNKECCQG